MAAKKSRGWRSGKREGRSRMVQMTRHLVVTVGKETEPRYFGKRGEALQRAGRLVTTIEGWVTLSHLRKTLQPRWAKYSM